jgi:hypothetical protein
VTDDGNNTVINMPVMVCIVCDVAPPNLLGYRSIQKGDRVCDLRALVLDSDFKLRCIIVGANANSYICCSLVSVPR